MVRPTIRPVNRVPMMPSWMNDVSAAISPMASTMAITAAVPVPPGDRSAWAAAEMVTFLKADRSSVDGAVKMVPSIPRSIGSSGWLTVCVSSIALATSTPARRSCGKCDPSTGRPNISLSTTA